MKKYSVSFKNVKFKKNKVNGLELFNLEGFTMFTKKGFNINNQLINDLKIIDKSLAYKIVSEKVERRYKKLLNLLTELIISDDDSGSDYREALNQIERFRLEIKNKYRHYLKQKEIEKMSHELTTLKKEAEKRLIILNENIISYKNGKGK